MQRSVCLSVCNAPNSRLKSPIKLKYGIVGHVVYDFSNLWLSFVVETSEYKVRKPCTEM